MDRKLLIRAAMGVTLALALVHPAAASETATKLRGPPVIFIMKALSNPYWEAMKQGAEDTAKAMNVEAPVLGQLSDLQKEEQLNLCQAAIARHPRLIAMGAATSAIGIECMKQAAAQGIEGADIDATLPPDLMKRAGLSLAFSLNDDNLKIGALAANFIAGRLKGTAPKVLVIEGAVGSPPGQDRPLGFRDELKKLRPDVRIVSSVSAEWDRLRAMNIAADFLIKDPDLQAIFCANDVMALGAVEAARQAGKSHQVTIVGVDAIADARQAIRDGTMAATVAKFPYWVGKRAVELAVARAKGRAVPKAETTPILLMTKDILDRNEAPLLRYVR